MNLPAARAWVRRLRALGVREWCLAAGARNSPLLLAVTEEPGLVKRRFVDERSMGFFGLGRVMATGEPVALATTSGTAAGELLPALMEAHYQGLPLLAVTADRPRSHAGKGTPQSVWQPGLYGVHAPTLVDWESGEPEPQGWETAFGSLAGPAHVNLRFREPLLSGLEEEAGSVPVPAPCPLPAPDASEAVARLQAFLNRRDPLLVLAAGLPPRDVPVVRDFLVALQAPVVAELSANLSGERELAPLLCDGGEGLLASWAGGRVLRLGSVPSWRWWRDLENRPETSVCSVTPVPYPGLARDSLLCRMPLSALARVKPPRGSEDVASWRQRGGNRREETTRLLLDHPRSEPALWRSMARHVPAGSLLFLGNSLPVRLANRAADVVPAVRTFACRGVNGIDGQLSTFLALSADEPESWAFLGDLTTLYDMNAFLVASQLAPGRRRLVVMNNGGGRIFRQVGDLRSFPRAERPWLENPHHVSFARLAGLWGWEHVLVAAPGDVARAAWEPHEQVLIEVVPGETETAAFWAARR